MIEDESTVTEATESMKALNILNLPDDLHMAVNAGTDVTGFGLAGHLLDMLGGNLDCVINPKLLPTIAGVKELADMGLVPEGAYRNMAMYQDNVNPTLPSPYAGEASLVPHDKGGNRGVFFAEVNSGLNQSDIDMIYDAQTSGGLLLAVSPEKSEALLNHIRKEGFGKAEIIGVFTKGNGRIIVSERRL